MANINVKVALAHLFEARDYAYIQYNDKAVNNTEARLTSPYALNKGTGAYFTAANNQITIKKAGRYLVCVSLRLSAVTDNTKVKRFAVWRNGTAHTNCMARLQTWEDLTNFEVMVASAGDILTFYARAEDGNSTISRARAIILPLQ